jgi:hypothetical protein
MIRGRRGSVKEGICRGHRLSASGHTHVVLEGIARPKMVRVRDLLARTARPVVRQGDPEGTLMRRRIFRVRRGALRTPGAGPSLTSRFVRPSSRIIVNGAPLNSSCSSNYLHRLKPLTDRSPRGLGFAIRDRSGTNKSNQFNNLQHTTAGIKSPVALHVRSTRKLKFESGA